MKKVAKKEKNTKAEEKELEKNEADRAEEVAAESEADPKDAEISKLKDDVNMLNDKYLRLLAEFDNYKRRTQKEKEGTYDMAVGDTVNNIIPVLDTLEISMKNETGNIEDYRKGIELVIKKFNETLSKMGVTPIEAVGKPFDPEFHNAVMNSEDGEGESGTVLDEFQKGYMLKDKVIRHSMVKVKA